MYAYTLLEFDNILFQKINESNTKQEKYLNDQICYA